MDFLKGIITLHKNAIGRCCTCTHHIESTMPGFVTDYGYCEKKCKHFPSKVCGFKEVECPEYEEVSLEKECKELEKLQNEKNERGDIFSSFIMTRFERRE